MITVKHWGNYGIEPDGQWAFDFYYECKSGKLSYGLTHQFEATPLSPRSCWFGL